MTKQHTTTIAALLAVLSTQACASDDPWPQVWAVRDTFNTADTERTEQAVAQLVELANNLGMDVVQAAPAEPAHVTFKPYSAPDGVIEVWPVSRNVNGCRYVDLPYMVRPNGEESDQLIAGRYALMAVMDPAPHRDRTILAEPGRPMERVIEDDQRQIWEDYHEQVLAETCEVP